MADVKKVWNAEGKRLYLSHPSQEFEKLDNAIYTVGIDDFGRFFLVKNSDGFTFNYKLYGLESDLINRIIKTYEATSGNLGVLLNGLKGTGKTVSSKVIATNLNQPIILVDSHIKGIHTFLNSISQNITIFIDEYEKVFGDSSAMLTIMDGALNSEFRRVFLLTTNELYVEKNLIQRPGRIRYLKKFEDLKPAIVEEIVDDVLVHTQFKKECINFISNLETITVDIVKAIINEVNIHEEGPSAFESIFNVKKLKGKYNISMKDDDGQLVELASSVGVYPRPMFTESHDDYRFEIDNQSIGIIRRVINFSTIEVEPFDGEKGEKLGFTEPIIVKVEDADIINYAYAYDGYGSSMVPKPKKGVSKFAKNIIDKIHDDREEGDEIMSEERIVKMQSKPLRLESVGEVSHSDISESFSPSESISESYGESDSYDMPVGESDGISGSISQG